MESVEEALAGARARALAAEERLRSQTMLRAEAEHRLKTSLAVITGWAATLEERWDQLGEQRRREGVAIIRRASDELAEQASRLLEDARAELLSLDADPVRLDLDAVLAVTTAAFGGLPDGHVVEHLPAGAPVVVDVDPAALQQVLGHLIENAVKYSPSGGRVTLAARADDVGVVLDVRDEGIGVPLGVDLFAPFRRGEGTDEVPGVGLGLYIVRNLCRAMGGDVSARANVGGGSTFTVQLPAAG
ncbi:MAG: sensor histidine kinase [Actinomycetia bacterium]|nr:sensor histidine kinase [Actinomycetes bacterium]